MTAAHVVIRRPSAQDGDALLGLIADHARFEHGTATLELGALLSIIESDQPPVNILVAARGCDVLGYAALTFDFALWRGRVWAHLDCLFVREDSRGAGIGASLLRAAMALADKAGIDRMEWQTPVWNADAISFYRRIGAEAATKVRFAMAPNRPASPAG